MKKYKVSELSSILGISEQAIRSKVKRNILPSIEETVDNRAITFIPLEDEDLNILINKTNRNRNIYPSVGATIDHSEDIIESTVVEAAKSPNNMDTLIEYLKHKDQQVDNIYSTLIEKNKEIADKDKQIYLLEDSEKRKENDYLRQIAELKAQIAILSQQPKKQSWEFWKRG